jgi:hypothetical protein
MCSGTNKAPYPTSSAVRATFWKSADVIVYAHDGSVGAYRLRPGTPVTKFIVER